MNLDNAEVFWILHLLPPEKLPDVAADLLTEGVDCEALRMLAGLTSKELSDAPRLFEQSL